MQGTPSVRPLPSLSPGTFSVYSSALWLVVCGCALRDFCLFCLVTCHVKQLFSRMMSFRSLAIKAHLLVWVVGMTDMVRSTQFSLRFLGFDDSTPLSPGEEPALWVALHTFQMSIFHLDRQHPKGELVTTNNVDTRMTGRKKEESQVCSGWWLQEAPYPQGGGNGGQSWGLSLDTEGLRVVGQWTESWWLAQSKIFYGEIPLVKPLKVSHAHT